MEEYKKIAQACGDKIGKINSQNEFHLGSDKKKKAIRYGFYKYIRSKRPGKESVGLLLTREKQELIIDDINKTKVFNAFLHSLKKCNCDQILNYF